MKIKLNKDKDKDKNNKKHKHGISAMNVIPSLLFETQCIEIIKQKSILGLSE